MRGPPELGAKLFQGLLRFLSILDEEQVLLLQLSIELQQGAWVVEVHGPLLLLLQPHCSWGGRLLHAGHYTIGEERYKESSNDDGNISEPLC